MELAPEVHLSRQSAEAMARGLMALAAVDGIHEREAGLIASFWIDMGGNPASLSALQRGAAISPDALAIALHGDERALFLKTAVLLVWADGKVSPEERTLLGEFAKALDVDQAGLDGIESGVKEYLLGHLSHLHNVDATTQVARKLGI